jgi:hypothetical protein
VTADGNIATGGFSPAGPALFGTGAGYDIAFAATVLGRSSVLASGNSCAALGGMIYPEGVNLDRDGSCPGSTLHADPKLAPLAVNVGGRYVRFPKPHSPLIDAAQDCKDAFGGLVAKDALGTSRPQGVACDLGAVEADRPFGDGFGD